MAECPTGMLVDLCSDTPPKIESKETFQDFLATLGVSYTVANGSVVVNPGHQEMTLKRKSTASISEDDFITNEKFDFKQPMLEDIELSEPVLTEEEPKVCEPNILSDVAFQFPVLSMNSSPRKLDWNSEVSVEARKVSRRISFITTPIDCEDLKHNSLSHNFLSKCDISSDKENLSKLANTSPPFVPNPDPVEALTPEGVRKISGPDWRRGTFTLDKGFLTPKSKPRMVAPSSTGNRRASSACRLNSTPTTQTQFTPKMVQRSKSFVNTPEVTSKISTFRKGPPVQVGPHTRPRSNLSFCGQRLSGVDQVHRSTPGQSRLDREPSLERPHSQFQLPKVGGPSPLLRRALAPNLGLKMAPATTSTASKMRGPLKAAPIVTQRNTSQTSMSSTSSSSAATSRLLQPRNLSANRSLLANKKTY